MTTTREQDQIALLVEAYGRMLGRLHPEELFPAILDLARQMLEVDAYAVWRRDPEWTWRIAACFGLSDAYLAVTIADPKNATPLVDPVLVPDLLDAAVPGIRDRAELYRREGLRSMLVAPMWRLGEFAGTIAFYHRSQRAFSEGDVRLGSALGNLAASAIAVAELYTAEQTARARAEEAQRRAELELAERLRAEEELAKSEARFRTLIEKATDIVSIVGLDGSFQYISPSVADIMGYRPEELIGAVSFEKVHPEDLARVQTVFAEVLGAPTPVSMGRVSYRFQDKRGAWRWLESVGRPLLENGAPAAMVVNSRDVTERVHAEEAVEQLNARLRQAMVETHHRVKNNLQVICAMIDMRLMEGKDAVPADDMRHLMGHVRTLAEIHDLLTANAKRDGIAESISAQAVLERLVPLLRNAAGAREICAELDDASLSLRQGTSLALITNELVSNAVKYGAGAIDIRFDVSGPSATLEVCDEGEGFEPGFDGSAANTGLELVEMLGRWDLNGVIRYDNRPEGGARVRVQMPLTGGVME